MIHIALEGIDGCGKSTQFARLTELVESANMDFSVFHYTGRTSRVLDRLIEGWRQRCGAGQRKLTHCERLVQELLYSTNARYNWRRTRRDTELLLADRSVLTALAAHRNLLPRTNLSWRLVRLMEAGVPLPDAVIFLDIDPAVASKRIDQRGTQRNADENFEMAQGMREAYYRLRKQPTIAGLRNLRWRIVDGSEKEDHVARSVVHALVDLLLKCGWDRPIPNEIIRVDRG